MKKLLNPFALVFEGFVMGACIFIATGSFDADVQQPVESAAVTAPNQQA